MVELLGEHIRRADTERLHPWLDSARRAAQSIDEWGMVAFQGAHIQDAFRNTIDAMIVFAQSSGGAP